MNQPNRRHFVSSIALGGIAGIAGCIGDGNDDSRPDDSDDPESGDDERAGEITDVRGSATTRGSEKGTWSVVEVEFDVRGELEESVELVIQALPQKYTSPEFESEEPDDVRTLDKIQRSSVSMSTSFVNEIHNSSQDGQQRERQRSFSA